MPKKSEYDLFLSYSSADRDAVLEIRSGFETLGVKTFLDRAHLNPGRPWPKWLEAARYLAYGMTEDNRDSETVDITTERLCRDEACRRRQFWAR